MNDEDLMQLDRTDDEVSDERVLLALFDRIVRQNGTVEAANVLGISYPSVAKVRDTRLLTPHITNALEVFMLSEANPVIQELVTKVGVLQGHVESLRARDKELATTLEKMQTATEASQESLVKMVRSTARKVDKLGVPEKNPAKDLERTDGGSKAASAKSAFKKEPQRTTKWFPRRTYPQLVTEEPAEDDETVYKEAWPVVREWRELSKGHPVKGKTLTWMKRQERVLELEVRLLDEFQLTLPLERHPIDKEWRSKLLRWHDDDLRSIRGRIVRRLMLRWVRRILTLGLWQK